MTTLSVRDVQTILRLPADGVLGPSTRAAIVEFQCSHGLTPDGYVGPHTTAALLAAEAGTQIAGLPAGPVREALARALRDVGKRESPSGSNRGAAIDHLNPDGQPWCASACCAWTGLPRIPKVLHDLAHPSWPSLERWARERGALSDVPAPGAIYLMARAGSGSDAGGGTAGHAGLYVGQVRDRRLSIDGNVGDAVAIVLREPSAAKWWVHWWRA